MIFLHCCCWPKVFSTFVFVCHNWNVPILFTRTYWCLHMYFSCHTLHLFAVVFYICFHLIKITCSVICKLTKRSCARRACVYLQTCITIAVHKLLVVCTNLPVACSYYPFGATLPAGWFNNFMWSCCTFAIIINKNGNEVCF